MKNLKLAKHFYNKHKNTDKFRIGDLFNLCLLILEERKLIEINIPISLDIIYTKILQNKLFEYSSKKVKNETRVQYSCTLKKNKHILQKINKTPFDPKLYAKYLDNKFYLCKWKDFKVSKYYLVLIVGDPKATKGMESGMMMQQCTLKAVKKNMSKIFTYSLKFKKIAKEISPTLYIEFRIRFIE